MRESVYRYQFAPSVFQEEVECALLLSVMACESLYGYAETRLDAGFFLDESKRACVIDAGTPVGRTFNRLFVGFLAREISSQAFQVERIEKDHAP
jgi:hypothetical protein